MHTPVAPQLSATSAGKRLTLLHRMAWICAVLVLVITSLSAFIRLSKAGLGCEPWPQCYGQELRAQQQGAEPAQADAATAAARLAHRVIASTALLLILVMVMTALASRPALWPEGRLTLWLLFLALFLAVLGRWTSDARLPAVTLGNLLGGFAMFAVSVRLALVTSRSPTSSPAPDRLAGWAWLGAFVLMAQVALGGMVSAGQAGLSCQGFGGCDVGAGSWQALNPWVEPLTDATQPTHPAGALVHVLHRAGALVVVAVLLPLALLAWRNGRRTSACLILALLGLQAALGVALVSGSLPLAVALAHNMAAALLLAVLLGMSARRDRSPPMLSPAL